MANNYITFSEEIDNLTAEETEWLKQTLKRNSKLSDESRLDFEYAFITDPVTKIDTMWIHSDENGSVEDTAAFMQRFLIKWRPDRFLTISWAETCSKPRIGEFGGGSVFVTAKRCYWTNNYDFLHDMEEKFKEDPEAAADGTLSWDGI